MSRAKLLRVYALALAATMTVACGSSSHRTARDNNDKGAGQAERTAGETGRAMDDAAVTTKVKSKLASESRLATLKDIDISTNNGVVTLAGTVPSDEYKKDVEQVARSVDGVTDVKNDIKVEKASTSNTRRDRDRDRGDSADRSR